MEKIKITREQEKAIEWYRENFTNEGAIQDFIRDRHPALSEFTTEQFALLFLEWYEVEPEFKVGEFVTNPTNGVVKEIKTKEEADFFNNHYIKTKELRHSTPEEIAEEKERRWWAKHDRNVWELKRGDILVHIDDGIPAVVTNGGYIGGFEMNHEHFNKQVVKDNWRVVCFTEDREDVSK